MRAWFKENAFNLISVGGVLLTIGIWVGGVNERLDSLADRVDSLADAVHENKVAIAQNSTMIMLLHPRPAMVAGSNPQLLTPFGEEVAARIDAHGWAERVSRSVVGKTALASMEPNEIEKISGDYVAEASRKDVQERVQRAIREFGGFGLDRELVLPVLRVPLVQALSSRQASLHP